MSRRGIPADSGDSGFSLVEALIALLMLTAGALVMAGGLSSTNRAARDSLEALVAEHLVREKIEELRVLPAAEVRSGSESIQVDGIRFDREWRVSAGPHARLSQINVDVTWSEYSVPLTQPLQKTLSKPGGALGNLGSSGRIDVTSATDIETTVEELIASGRTRTRSMTGYRAN